MLTLHSYIPQVLTRTLLIGLQLFTFMAIFGIAVRELPWSGELLLAAGDKGRAVHMCPTRKHPGFHGHLRHRSA